jgi:hypothetical protein
MITRDYLTQLRLTMMLLSLHLQDGCGVCVPYVHAASDNGARVSAQGGMDTHSSSGGGGSTIMQPPRMTFELTAITNPVCMCRCICFKRDGVKDKEVSAALQANPVACCGS